MGEINMALRETHIIGRETREAIVSARMCPALAAHGISLAGLTEADAEFRFARVRPAMGQILVCVAGEGRVWLEGAWELCGPGWAYVTPPGVAHAYHALRGTPWRLAWVNFEAAAPLGMSGADAKPTLRAADPRPLVGALEGLYQECLGAAEPPVLRLWADLLHACALRLLSRAGVTSEPRLRRLWEAVDGDLAYPWDLETLAARAGVSGEHLRRLCRSHLGVSPMRHVRRLRMRRAAALLEATGCTVQAVAAQVGYENAFAFSTAFKRDVGLTPSQSRR